MKQPVIGGCGHGSYALRSQADVARELGLTKRQVQVAEKSALEKIRKAYRKPLDEERR